MPAALQETTWAADKNWTSRLNPKIAAAYPGNVAVAPLTEPATGDEFMLALIKWNDPCGQRLNTRVTQMVSKRGGLLELRAALPEWMADETLGSSGMAAAARWEGGGGKDARQMRIQVHYAGCDGSKTGADEYGVCRIAIKEAQSNGSGEPDEWRAGLWYLVEREKWALGMRTRRSRVKDEWQGDCFVLRGTASTRGLKPG